MNYIKKENIEVNKVYKTDDLSIFTQIKGNRPPNPQHIRRLADSIKINGVLQMSFWVNCTHYWITHLLFPRWTVFRPTIWTHNPFEFYYNEATGLVRTDDLIQKHHEINVFIGDFIKDFRTNGVGQIIGVAFNVQGVPIGVQEQQEIFDIFVDPIPIDSS